MHQNKLFKIVRKISPNMVWIHPKIWAFSHFSVEFWALLVLVVAENTHALRSLWLEQQFAHKVPTFTLKICSEAWKKRPLESDFHYSSARACLGLQDAIEEKLHWTSPNVKTIMSQLLVSKAD